MEVIASMGESEQGLACALSLGLEDTSLGKLLALSPGDSPTTALESLPRALPIASKNGVASVSIVGHLSYGKFTAELETIRAASEIQLYVNSGGGDSRIALEFATALDGKNAVATIDGKACSASLSIVQACAHRRMTDGSRLMVHPLCAFAAGGPAELRQAASHVEEIMSQHLALYAKRIPASEVRRWWDSPGDVWFNAEQAIEAKLVDEVIAPFPSAAVCEGVETATPPSHPDADIEDLLIRVIARARGLFNDRKQFAMVLQAFLGRECQ